MKTRNFVFMKALWQVRGFSLLKIILNVCLHLVNFPSLAIPPQNLRHTDPLHSKNVIFLCLCPLKCETLLILTCIYPEFVTKEVFSLSSTEDVSTPP